MDATGDDESMHAYGRCRTGSIIAVHAVRQSWEGGSSPGRQVRGVIDRLCYNRLIGPCDASISEYLLEHYTLLSVLCQVPVARNERKHETGDTCKRTSRTHNAGQSRQLLHTYAMKLTYLHSLLSKNYSICLPVIGTDLSQTIPLIRLMFANPKFSRIEGVTNYGT